MARSALPEQYDAVDGRTGYFEQDEVGPAPCQSRAPRETLLARAMKRWRTLAKLGVLVALGLAAYSYMAAPPVVRVIEAKSAATRQTLGATGKVRGTRVVDLGVDTTGVVRGIFVHEGDTVRVRQLILSLDRSEATQRVAAAQAAVAGAVADAAKASRGPLASEIARANAELAQAMEVGRARVDAAEAKLRNVMAGTRPQEIAAAKAELESRQEILAKAQKDYQRTQKLVDEGAVARANLDSAATDVQTAKATVTAQQQHLSLLQEGATSDEIAEARAALSEATATRDTSTRASKEAINTLLANPRPEEVASARAHVNEANAQFRQAQDAMAKSDLRAPFDGVVAQVAVEEGRAVSPGDKLVSFQEMSKPLIEVETDESNLNDLQIGQAATVTSDAYPGKSFQAILTDLGSQVNSDRGTITIKLSPVGNVSWLRPDLTVDVNIVTRRSARGMIVPPDALTRYAGNTAVLVVRNEKTVPIRVGAGAMGETGVVITGGVKDGDLVVRSASQVRPNSRVRVDMGDS